LIYSAGLIISEKNHGQYTQFPIISKEFNNWVDNAEDLWKLVEKMNFTFKS